MFIWSFLQSLVRDKIIEKASDPTQEALLKSNWIWFGIPIGVLLAIGLFFGRVWFVFHYFEEPHAVKEITEKLESLGFEEPVVTHDWFGYCVKGRTPYKWATKVNHGVACVGGPFPIAIHKR